MKSTPLQLRRRIRASWRSALALLALVAAVGAAGCRERGPSEPASSAFTIPPQAVALAFTAQPANASPRVSLAPVVVSALDSRGERATGFAGTITLSLGANPSGATLSGATTVTAVAGVATFSTVQISDPGVGVALRATADGLMAATSGPFDVATPDVSASTGRIAFVSDRDLSQQIYVMNADGSGLTKLTSVAAPYSHPAWSPDDGKIAFAKDGQGIFVMNADGSGVTQVAAEGSDPAWSADGSRIRFARSVDGTTTAIVEVTLDGARSTTLYTGALGGRLSSSPDGTTVAFEFPFVDEDLTQVYLMNTSGSGFRRLTSSADATQYAEGAPAWSPNGNRIAFWSYRYGIATMRPTGSEPPSSVFKDFPAVSYRTSLSWSPDGRSIAFVRRGRDIAPQIWVANADGEGTPHRIGSSGANAWDPAWSRRASVDSH